MCLHVELMNVGWNAHSPRAGFASTAMAEGKDFVTTREEGRWLDDKQLRMYTDIEAASTIALKLKTHDSSYIFGSGYLDTPYSMNSLFSESFRKFGGIFLEVCETI